MSAKIKKELEQKAHSELGASSMYRWGNCPGSVRLSRGVAKTTSVYAEEGTLAHECGANILDGKPLPKDKRVTKEMLEAVQVYVDFVNEESKGAERGIEHRFDLSSIHPGCFGTTDAWVYKRAEKKLIVIDYKHGQGLAVDVESNEQLMYYALGALVSLNLPCSTVELVIVQPRCSHPSGTIRRWSFPSIEILDFAHTVDVLAKATENDNAPTIPGEWCRFCPAAGICPSLQANALQVAQAEFSPTLSYDPVKLSETLSKLPVLEAFIKGVKDFAYSEASHGRVPPGWKLVSKRAVRRWKKPDNETAEDLRAHFHIPSRLLYDEAPLKSPAQFEKLLSKKHKGDLALFTESVSSGMTLAPDSDDRPAAKTDAASEFGVIETTATPIPDSTQSVLAMLG